ncbi:MAG: GC-type dockerin domain-anchored protein [Phycisphaerales bacterium JB039]
MAQPAAVAGFRVDVYALVDRPTAMAWGPGGAFGDDLYVATGSGDILRVGDGGVTTLFATGLAYPTGLAFAETPAFGDLLYVTELADGKIRTVDSAGVVGDFVTIAGSSVNLADLAFGPGTGGFTNELYVTDSATSGFVAGKLYRIDAAGGVTTLFGTDPFTAQDMVFAVGAGFGAGLIVADALNYAVDDGGVRSFDAAGGFVELISAPASDLFNPSGVALGPGGAFGADLYVSDFGTNTIYTLSAGGVLVEFATGFCFSTGGNSFDADLLFAEDASFLLVADYTRDAIYRIGPGEPPCRADCDGSGALDFFDFLCFQNLFAVGHPEADCDGSCTLDLFDFLCFQNEFAAGCP